MAWIAATHDRGLKTGALGAGWSGSWGGSGWLWAASGEEGVRSCWWAAFLSLPLPRWPPRPHLGGGGGDSEGERLDCQVTLLVVGGPRGSKQQWSSQWRRVGPFAGGSVVEVHSKDS